MERSDEAVLACSQLGKQIRTRIYGMAQPEVQGDEVVVYLTATQALQLAQLLTKT